MECKGYTGRQFIVKARFNILGLNDYLHNKISKEKHPSPMCPACKQTLETIPHFLLGGCSAGSQICLKNFLQTIPGQIKTFIQQGSQKEQFLKTLMFRPFPKKVTKSMIQQYAKSLGYYIHKLWNNRKTLVPRPPRRRTKKKKQ